MWNGYRPPLATAGEWKEGGPPEELLWRGVGPDQRWAMEVLGLRADVELARTDIQARFRRLVRLAHPDHGAEGRGAAERLAELAEARTVLLDVLAASADEESAG
jgi:hypothetical protein